MLATKDDCNTSCAHLLALCLFSNVLKYEIQNYISEQSDGIKGDPVGSQLGCKQIGYRQIMILLYSHPL
jgi:hypothetical protein